MYSSFKYQNPLNLAHSLNSGQAFRWRIEKESSQKWFNGIVDNELIKIRRISDEIQLIHNDNFSPIESIFSYLRLDDDLEEIYQSFENDNILSNASRNFSGMRILRQDPWETIISFMLATASNIPRIQRHIEDLSENFGNALSLNGLERGAFPTPVQLANVGEEKLRQMGIGFRSKNINIVANLVAEKKFDPNKLRTLTYENCLQSLISLPGIGDKVANCIMLFAIDKIEAFPVDVWIERIIKENYLPDPKVSKTVIRSWAQENFGSYAGYANHYLFHSTRTSET
ncbi:MAG: DNA-3-methyladenine glycosylase 2 family protein [SAR202 cluster bacterium]|nr:8-oxoguanine DNA glycosylase [Chloroflexota bacterium]MCH2307746.1 DNA-3-methyladenine glycosylase 2 family protein [SAR202 cluster bacterium]|tara:strand:+ start:24658 stop:25512 length:855 start_codon:yes stop_codon:yes gene_type:complete